MIRPHISTIKLVDRPLNYKEADTRIIKIRKKPEVQLQFRDFVVDGEPLSRTLAKNNKDAPADCTMLLTGFVQPEQIKYLKRLLGEQPPDLQSGRTAIYVCPIDGDLMCGAAGCFVDFNEDTITWRDFAWDDDNTEEFPDGRWRT